MTRKRWKPVQPQSMNHAIRLCLDYARHKHNASVARIGDLVGVSEWAIHKWVADGSMPSQRIRPFEHACDATFVTQYIAASALKLTIDIPSGAAADQDSLLDLQNQVNEAVALLTRFYRGDTDAPEVLQGVTQAMKQLASHRENVIKADAPELELFDGAPA